ncbi:Co-chaperone protein DjlA [BD1-7 clade bacterium]|uniref:Co-chaperone protein DjlA n=1 Tax=BD1-7 clade bacterium TaxID=2029982 RepID=A0A5S9PYH9_9GAMM|nr:Co-chaperone protein DjlA [BD1-7 clade bacterium]CAA0109533.1 Co-chaperone protein DjlA [BD1-7 clade bacterium]CAA0124177.1 Co-chaperone protein DjlA [BD1-7 clade bacterium]
MTIWGRLLGTLIGATTLGFFGALIGFMIGSLIDRQGALRLAAGRVGASGRSAQDLFMELLFTALGDVAKSDGRISEREIALTESIITQFGLNDDGREQAIAWFKRGAEKDYDYQQLLRAFAQTSRFRPDLKKVLLEMLIGLALVDGQLEHGKRQVLHGIAHGLGIPAPVFDQLLQILQGQASFGNQGGQQYQGHHQYGSQARPSRDMLEDAFKALGVKSTASDREVKQAYRKLMSQHHPDKLMSQGVPDHVIKVATQKSQAIQAAYDVIKKHRKEQAQVA